MVMGGAFLRGSTDILRGGPVHQPNSVVQLMALGCSKPHPQGGAAFMAGKGLPNEKGVLQAGARVRRRER